jgi:hypothetical protein
MRKFAWIILVLLAGGTAVATFTNRSPVLKEPLAGTNAVARLAKSSSGSAPAVSEIGRGSSTNRATNAVPPVQGRRPAPPKGLRIVPQ